MKKKVVKKYEALETGAVVSQLTDAVESEVDNFFADGVMSTSEIVRGIFLAGDQLFRMEKLTVRAGAHLIDHRWLQIEENCAGNLKFTTLLKFKKNIYFKFTRIQKRNVKKLSKKNYKYAFASASLTEEGVESIITAANGLVGGHLTIGLDAVLETEQFPAGVTDLDTGLTNVQT